MTMSTLILGIRSALQFRTIKIDNVDLNMKVDSFKVEVSKQAQIIKENLELVYCGNILDDEATLVSCGVKHGVMVHVLKRKPEMSRPSPSISDKDIHSLVSAFREIRKMLSPAYSRALQKLIRPELLENVIAITPGLAQDPVAISLIRDTELISRMGDIDTVRRIVELHPALAEAASLIAATVQQEMLSSSTAAAPAPPETGYSYSLEALSDEDDLDSSQSSGSQPRQQSFITNAQLAAALANANDGASTSGSSSSGITSEMFNQAMQRAIANVVPGSSSSSSMDQISAHA